MRTFYDGWQIDRFSCRNCGWSGNGQDLQQDGILSEHFELDCPQCGRLITVVLHPTEQEMRDNLSRLSEWDRQNLIKRDALLEDFSRRGLRSPVQLPELRGDELLLIWDCEGKDTIIRCGTRVIWREPCFWEGYHRYLAVGEILLARYGDRLRDLVPSESAKLYLYGDYHGSVAAVEQFRQRMLKGAGRLLPLRR